MISTLQPGSHVGSYEILGPIGAGGMGEVYRARDSKLKRDVAIKVLPDAFSRDPERAARFQREAEILASLNHPHIAQIYGQEQSGGTRCLVLEYVDGETLQERLRRGAIPLEDAQVIASQIAKALEAAHQRGIVHRDLKPANVKITPSGEVKVLDFGLAKAVEPAPGEDFSNSPTLLSGQTGVGAILGTSAYMSPEQAKGKPTDARSDVWAFGAVFFEMLTGRPAFTGETIVEILGGVLKADPDWNALPPTTPPLIRSLLRRCLRKDRNQRLHDIADARIEIEEAVNDPVGVVAVGASSVQRRERLLWTLGMLAIITAAAIMSASYFRLAPNDAPEMRLQITTPPPPRQADALDVMISPDGGKVVFQAITDGKRQLWIRFLNAETPQPLAGTDNASRPFWSPDSQSIGFFADQKLKRIDISGGPARDLADATAPLGGTWNVDGIILFVPSNTSGIYRIAEDGGTPVEVTRVDAAHAGYRFPYFLPDGRHFLFLVNGTQEVRGVYVGSLDSVEIRRLLEADTRAVFGPPDYVFFGRQETLFAQRLDLESLDLVGQPFVVSQRVAQFPGNQFGHVGFSASMTGTLAYRTSTSELRQLTWFDRSGMRTGIVGAPNDGGSGDRLRLSPDGSAVTLPRTVNGNLDVWQMEIARGILRRLTSDRAPDCCAFWSPDGSRLVFESYRKGLYDIYEKSIDDAGDGKVLLESPENKNARDWSPDGRFILYTSQNPKTGRDLWVLPLDGDRTPSVVVQTSFEEYEPRFSPDGRWIVYTSNETGLEEVYVQSFPPIGLAVRISTDGGNFGQWRGDSREIFYVAPGNRLMAVPIVLQANPQTINVGTPVNLFTVPTGGLAVSPDGQRFLTNVPLEDTSAWPINILLNWAGQLNRGQ